MKTATTGTARFAPRAAALLAAPLLAALVLAALAQSCGGVPPPRAAERQEAAGEAPAPSRQPQAVERMDGPPPRQRSQAVEPLPAPSAREQPSPDRWIAVSSAQELAGNWEGSLEIPVPANDGASLPATRIDLVMKLGYSRGDSRASVGLRVDLKRFLNDMAAVPAVRNQGLTMEDLWARMESEFRAAGQYTVGRYWLGGDISDTPENLISGRSGVRLYLDAARARLRVVFNQRVSFNLGDQGFTEIVLRRALGVVL